LSIVFSGIFPIYFKTGIAEESPKGFIHKYINRVDFVNLIKKRFCFIKTFNCQVKLLWMYYLFVMLEIQPFL